METVGKGGFYLLMGHEIHSKASSFPPFSLETPKDVARGTQATKVEEDEGYGVKL